MKASSVFPQVRQPGDDRPVDVHQRAAAGEGDRGGLRQALCGQQLSRVGRQGHGGHANRELGTYIYLFLQETCWLFDLSSCPAHGAQVAGLRVGRDLLAHLGPPAARHPLLPARSGGSPGSVQGRCTHKPRRRE